MSCECKPGTYDEGWQERRCDACIKAELDAWGHVMGWVLNGDIVKRLREEQA